MAGIDEMQAFDDALQRVVDAARTKTTQRAAYERAWYEFWTTHFARFMQHARSVARRRMPLELVDVFESELLAAVVKKIDARSGELNRRVLAGMRDNVILRVLHDLGRELEDDRYEKKLHDLASIGHLDEALHAQLQHELDLILTRVDGPRSTIKSRVLRAILDGPDDAERSDDAVFKKNGAINLAGVARFLGEPEGSVRRALNELRAEIPSRFPHLAEYLEIRTYHVETELSESIDPVSGGAQ